MSVSSRPGEVPRAAGRGESPVSVARLWGGVELLAKTLLIALVAVMVAVSLAQVFWRYVFNDPLTWSEELARYAFVWIGYLSGWLAWKHRAHIALDAVTYLNRPALTRFTVRLVELLVLAFAAYTFYSNFRLLGLTIDQPSAILEIPMAYVYAGYNVMALLIGGDILMTWFGVLRRADS